MDLQTFAQLFGGIGGGISGFVVACVLIKDRVRLNLFFNKKRPPVIIINNPTPIELSIIRLGMISRKNKRLDRAETDVLSGGKKGRDYTILENISWNQCLTIPPVSSKKY